MQTLPFQPTIAERMLVNTQDENISRDAQFFQTANGYWIAWHEGTAALLAPNTPPDIPCFWVEGTDDLTELVAMVENGEFDNVEEFDGDDEAWQQVAGCGCSHDHDEDSNKNAEDSCCGHSS